MSRGCSEIQVYCVSITDFKTTEEKNWFPPPTISRRWFEFSTDVDSSVHTIYWQRMTLAHQKQRQKRERWWYRLPNQLMKCQIKNPSTNLRWLRDFVARGRVRSKTCYRHSRQSKKNSVTVHSYGEQINRLKREITVLESRVSSLERLEKDDNVIKMGNLALQLRKQTRPLY